jgi:hypothetical protein
VGNVDVHFEEVGELPASIPPVGTIHVKPGTRWIPSRLEPTMDFVTGVGRIKLQGILKKDLGKQARNLRGRLR